MQAEGSSIWLWDRENTWREVGRRWGEHSVAEPGKKA